METNARQAIHAAATQSFVSRLKAEGKLWPVKLVAYSIEFGLIIVGATVFLVCALSLRSIKERLSSII
jgi:hypothetical protein